MFFTAVFFFIEEHSFFRRVVYPVFSILTLSFKLTILPNYSLWSFLVSACIRMTSNVRSLCSIQPITFSVNRTEAPTVSSCAATFSLWKLLSMTMKTRSAATGPSYTCRIFLTGEAMQRIIVLYYSFPRQLLESVLDLLRLGRVSQASLYLLNLKNQSLALPNR